MASAEHRRVRLAVVGCGDIAETGHLPAIARSADVELLGLVDVDASRRHELATRYDVPDSADLASARAWGADGVILATPPEVTPIVATSALAQGLDALVEKPMAADIASGRRLHEVAQASDRIVQVGFVNRFSPVVQRVKQWIDEGRLGHPLIFALSSADEPFDPDDTRHVARMFHFLRHGPAFVHEAAHLTDYVLHLGGGRAASVAAVGLRTDTAFPSENYTSAVVRLDNGSVARMEVTWLLRVLPAPTFWVAGPQGRVVVDRAKGLAELRSSSGDDRVQLSRPWVDESFDGQLAAFAHSIRTRSPQGPTTAEGLASLALCHGIVEAMNQDLAATDMAKGEAHHAVP
jgi:predicted dehydrogenase